MIKKRYVAVINRENGCTDCVYKSPTTSNSWCYMFNYKVPRNCKYHVSKMLQRTENKMTKYATIVILIAIIIISLVSVYQLDNSVLSQVKSGEVELHCATNGDWQKSLISKENVVGYNAELEHWTFTKGGASNCEIKNKGEL